MRLRTAPARLDPTKFRTSAGQPPLTAPTSPPNAPFAADVRSFRRERAYVNRVARNAIAPASAILLFVVCGEHS